jgi:peptidoglycan hydrolase-like protein with peptidoglycan-binding domain
MNKIIIISIISFSALTFVVSAQERAGLQMGDIDSNGPISTCLTLSGDVRFKMRDTSDSSNVRDLQDFLISSGLLQGESTGYFGAGTLKAVRQFQRENGLTPTGFVGPLTREKIKSVSCNETIPESEREFRAREVTQMYPKTEGNEDTQRVKKEAKGPADYLSSEDMAKLQALELAVKQAEKERMNSYTEFTKMKEQGNSEALSAYEKTLREKSKAWEEARSALESAKRTMKEKVTGSLTGEERKSFEVESKRKQLEEKMRNEGRVGDANSKKGQPSEMVSEADRQEIKNLEVVLKKAEEERKSSYIEWSKTKSDTNREGDVTAKASFSAKEDAFNSARKALEEKRRTIGEGMKKSITEEEKRNMEKKMKELEAKPERVKMDGGTIKSEAGYGKMPSTGVR